MDYGDVVYQAATSDLLCKLQRLQNRALRIITKYDDNYQSTTAIHQSLRILPLSRRRYVHTNNFAYKRSIQPKYVDNRNLLTRAHGKKLLLCPRPRTERFKNSGMRCRWMNSVPLATTPLSLKRRKGNWKNCCLLKREYTVLIVSC